MIENPVKILMFVSNTDNMKKYPVADSFIEHYLSDDFSMVDAHGNKNKNPSPDVPLELREEMLLNAWSDEDGHVWWSENYYPEPVKDNDGNVYLMMGNKQMETDRGRGVLLRSVMMCDEDWSLDGFFKEKNKKIEKDKQFRMFTKQKPEEY